MKRYLILIVLLPILIGGLIFIRKERDKNLVYAEGGIEITTATTPLFDASNFAPGQSLTGRVTVKNVSSEDQRIGFKLKSGKKMDLSFAGKLNLQVKDATNGAVLIGEGSGKKFSTLFLQTSDNYLFSLLPNQDHQVDLVVAFDPLAPNFFQGRTLNFDFSFGFIAKPQIIRIPTIRPRR